jgi:hypothetical protein
LIKTGQNGDRRIGKKGAWSWKRISQPQHQIDQKVNRSSRVLAAQYLGLGRLLKGGKSAWPILVVICATPSP